MTYLHAQRRTTQRILRRLGHRPEDVEDGAQEVLIELMNREQVGGGLVRTLARFASLTLRKAEGRRTRLLRALPGLAEGVDRIAACENLRQVEAWIADLSAIDRVIVLDMLTTGGAKIRHCMRRSRPWART